MIINEQNELMERPVHWSNGQTTGREFQHFIWIKA